MEESFWFTPFKWNTDINSRDKKSMCKCVWGRLLSVTVMDAGVTVHWGLSSTLEKWKVFLSNHMIHLQEQSQPASPAPEALQDPLKND